MADRKSTMKTKEIHDTLKSYGFYKHRAPSGGSSHSTWKHYISGGVRTMCENPAQGTLRALIKEIKEEHFTAVMNKDHKNADKYIEASQKDEYNAMVAEKRPDLLPKKKTDRQRLAKLRNDLQGHRQRTKQYCRGLLEEKPERPKNIAFIRNRKPELLRF